MREGDGAHHDVLEPPAAQQRAELLVVGEPEERRPDGDVRRRTGTRRRHRLEEHAENPGPPGYVPDRQREPAARDQNPRELATTCSGRPTAASGSWRPRHRRTRPETAVPPRRRDGTRAPDGVDARARASPRRCRRRRPTHLVRLRRQPRDPVPRPRRGRASPPPTSVASSSGPTSRVVIGTKNSSYPATCASQPAASNALNESASTVGSVMGGSYGRGPGSLNPSTRMRLGFRLRPRRHTGHAH